MAANDFLMQFQADILGIPVHRPHVTETTALGAAWMAAMGQGIVADTSVLEGLHSVEKTFNPTMTADQRETLFEGWKHAVKRLL